MRAGAKPDRGWKELGDAIGLIAILLFLAFIVWMEAGPCG